MIVSHENMFMTLWYTSTIYEHFMYSLFTTALIGNGLHSSMHTHESLPVIHTWNVDMSVHICRDTKNLQSLISIPCSLRLIA